MEENLNSAVSHASGLTMFTAAVFIIGEMSGTGVLSLPQSMDESGWTGLVMIILCCLISAYCGIKLSNCWMMIIDRNHSLRQGVRDPFPVIGYEACGWLGRYIVVISCYIQLFGVAVIFLLIAAHNIHSLLSHFVFQFCDWTIVIAILMIPISMLGTPKDFWPIAILAMGCTATACLFIFIQSLRQIPAVLPKAGEITFNSFFIAFGTILFCFGGAVMFPTIQADMINPREFKTSVILSYAIMLIFYLPVSITGFVVYGYDTQSNIIDNLNDNWIKTTIYILITGHLLTAFTIILNPMFQGIEELFKAPARFGIKRVLIRTSIILSVLFVAQSIPNFGPILSLVGGSTVSLLSFVLPCVFYIFLCRSGQYEMSISKPEYILLFTCIIIGVIGGIASTYSSIYALSSAETFKPPCYLNRTQ